MNPAFEYAVSPEIARHGLLFPVGEIRIDSACLRTCVTRSYHDRFTVSSFFQPFGNIKWRMPRLDYTISYNQANDMITALGGLLAVGKARGFGHIDGLPASAGELLYSSIDQGIGGTSEFDIHVYRRPCTKSCK